jgi:Flp pilus assembly protein TadG
VAVEYAILLPALLLFVLGIMESGRLFWTYSTLYRATEAAARCGAVGTPAYGAFVGCDTPALVESYAATQAYGLNLSPSIFTVSSNAATCVIAGIYGYQVTASLPFTLVIPFLNVGTQSGSLNILTLTPSACYPR